MDARIVTDLLVRGVEATVPPLHGDPAREQVEIERLRAHLVREFAPVVGAVVVDRLVDDAAAELHDARVRQFVPLLMERRVRRSISGCSTGPRG